MRVVLDTNVIVSGICFPGSVCGQILARSSLSVQLMWSKQLIDEAFESLARSKFDKYAPLELRLAAMQSLVAGGSTIFLQRIEGRCRDPRDDHVVQLALDSRCSSVVTGDQDLLVLDPLGELRVVTPSEFLNQLG